MLCCWRSKARWRLCCMFVVTLKLHTHKFLSIHLLQHTKEVVQTPPQREFHNFLQNLFYQKICLSPFELLMTFHDFHTSIEKNRPCVYSSLSFSLALLHSNTNWNFQILALFTHFSASDNISSITPSHLNTARIVSTHFCKFFVDFKAFFWKFSPTGMFILSQLTRKRK